VIPDRNLAKMAKIGCIKSLPVLVDAGYTIIASDLRGFGSCGLTAELLDHLTDVVGYGSHNNSSK